VRNIVQGPKHAAAISLAIVTGEAEALVNGVSRRETALTKGEHRG
jgi:hypothetical protein